MNSRPLVVRFGALGDMVLLAVLIRHLHARFGQPVDLLTSGSWTRPLLSGQPGVGDIFSIRSRRTPYWLSPEQQRLVRELRARGAGPTWLADVGNDKTLALLRRAGWRDEHCCDTTNLADLPGPHFADLFLRFAGRNPPVLGGEDLPLTARDAWPELGVSAAQLDDLHNWRVARGFNAAAPILVQPGNKRTMRRGPRQRASNAKYWPEERWAEVLRGLRALHPAHPILLLGVPQEAALNDEILQQAAIANAHNVAHELPVPRLVALCAAALGMVSVDTGPAHVAGAVNCPVVVLFGRADPAVYAPRSALQKVRWLQPLPQLLPENVLSQWQRLLGAA